FIQRTFPLAHQQSNFNDAQSLLSSGIVDSLGVLDLVTYIEDEFAVVIADDDLVAENFESIERMAEFIEAKQSAKILA
ncbi:MAG: acyl carrier protein, partial [Chloroflexota bacterium]|nr:acyl carrier protein [Chloroflexota bacterium]